MALPAMEATAKALVDQGVAVFRFNSTYFASEPRGEPSPERDAELEDLRAVLRFARAHERVDPQRPAAHADLQPRAVSVLAGAFMAEQRPARP